MLVTLGGASVGDYDLVQKALTDAGMELGFWRIAMRPGKPLMFGRIGAMLACSGCRAIRRPPRSAGCCSCVRCCAPCKATRRPAST